jgi:DNA-binding protein YbaB
MVDFNEDLLLGIRESMENMQKQMVDVYGDLADIKITGTSGDGYISVIMTATYEFLDLQIEKPAFDGGVEEFKRRMKEALKDVTQKIQKATQEKTMDLLKSVQVPDEIKKLSGDRAEGGDA